MFCRIFRPNHRSLVSHNLPIISSHPYTTSLSLNKLLFANHHFCFRSVIPMMSIRPSDSSGDILPVLSVSDLSTGPEAVARLVGLRLRLLTSAFGSGCSPASGGKTAPSAAPLSNSCGTPVSQSTICKRFLPIFPPTSPKPRASSMSGISPSPPPAVGSSIPAPSSRNPVPRPLSIRIPHSSRHASHSSIISAFHENK